MLKVLTRVGIRKGLLGDSRGWFIVLVMAGGLRILGRITRSEPRVVFCETLEDGESLIISKGSAVASSPPDAAKL